MRETKKTNSMRSVCRTNCSRSLCEDSSASCACDTADPVRSFIRSGPWKKLWGRSKPCLSATRFDGASHLYRWGRHRICAASNLRLSPWFCCRRLGDGANQIFSSFFDCTDRAFGHLFVWYYLLLSLGAVVHKESNRFHFPTYHLHPNHTTNRLGTCRSFGNGCQTRETSIKKSRSRGIFLYFINSMIESP